MLEGNTTLECLDIKSGGISPPARISLLLSSAEYDIENAPAFCFADAPMAEEINQVVSVVKKNYSLAVLDEGAAHDETGELGTLEIERSGTSLFD
jgi:hypothetical protein